MQLGATFSQHELTYLKLDIKKAAKEFSSLTFDWVRLACYWNETELKEGIFNFNELDSLVNFFEKTGTKIILTLGMKAPRWPEYYIPDWLIKDLNLTKNSEINLKNKPLLDKTLLFLEKVVNHYKNSKFIKIWQIENEPLDPSGENGWKLSKNFLKEEIDLTRKLDSSRKILINVWANELTKRGVYKDALDLSDIIGFDIYPNCPIKISDSKEKIHGVVNEIKNKGKEFWITELQAEPWEKPFNSKDIIDNFNLSSELEPEILLFWGFEHWLWKKLQGDEEYWQTAKSFLTSTEN